MASRTQTLLQLTDELVDLLDRRASEQGVSRSKLVRTILEQELRQDRESEISRRLVEGYSRIPQSEGRDAWGDLDAWTEQNTRRNLAALRCEEKNAW